MVTDSALLTLAHMGGIAIPQTCLQQENQEAEGDVGRSCSTTHIRAVSSCEQGAEAGTAPSGCSVVSFSVLAEGAVSPATRGSVNHCYQQKHDGVHVALSRGKKDAQQDNSEEQEEDGEVCRKEALKVLCNVIYNSPRAQERASALR